MNHALDALVMHVLSLGAGVQSSCLALMAARGELNPMPDCAIFADTQAEPASVYTWLDWLETQLPFPVVRVTAGSLTEDSLRVGTREDGKTWVKGGIPAFVPMSDGRSAPLPRRCTTDYKIVPIQRHLKSMREGRDVVQWIGISVDEVHRMKPARLPWIKNIWPLVEKRMNRNDCLRWMESSGYPMPPRSACVYCPYHGPHEWRRLKAEEPESFAAAVAYERRMQAVQHAATSARGMPFLHRSMKPLNEVDFSTDFDRGQGELFGNECEGMCGL
jgi:hypothetical protein